MSWVSRIAALSLLLIASGQAGAQSASFGLKLRVLPGEAVVESPVELPVPPDTQVLPPGRHAKRLLFAGNASAARRFYANTLPGLGFYLRADNANAAVWERGGVRAELAFYPITGAGDATGILVTMSSAATTSAAAQ